MRVTNLGVRLDQTYSSTVKFFSKAPDYFTPYLRRFVRLLALPYCFIFLINWKECTVSKLIVTFDLAYIFFRLKTFPFHYSLCRLWESNRSSWKYYYGSIYEPYQRSRLSKEVQPKKYSIVFDDKEVCYQLCRGINIPLPDQIAIIDPNEDYKSKIAAILYAFPEDIIIIKPVLGSGGRNILLAFIARNEIRVRDNEKFLSLPELRLSSRSVVQKYLKQHPDLEKFSKSFCTVRIATLLAKNGEVLILGALIRFGRGDSYVDNTSKGGVAVGVDICNGALKEYAYDFNSLRYSCHPDTKEQFKGFIIPDWEKLLELAMKVQHAFPYYKMLGLDIGITSCGPVLVEINPAHDNVGLEQKCGPILIDKRIRDEFRKYGLLITDHFAD